MEVNFLETPSLLVLAVVLLAVIGFVLSRLLRKKNTSKKEALLICGPCGAGKTALWTLLKNKQMAQTLTSIQANDEVFVVEPLNQRVHVVDFPGHPRLRPRLRDFLIVAKAIVFVVDSSAFVSLPVAAEFLYTLLTNPLVVEAETPILLFCSKSDSILSESEVKISTLIEEELNKLRDAGSKFTSVDEGQPEIVPLGTQGKPFQLKHAPVPVTVCKGSAKEGNINSLISSLQGQGIF